MALAVAAPSREDFAALLEDSFTHGNLQEGAVIKGKIVAIENECPHLGTRLSDGQVNGRSIRCAAHGYRWDLKTGRSLQGPRGPRRRPLRIPR